jgi:hypothetical protein
MGPRGDLAPRADAERRSASITDRAGTTNDEIRVFGRRYVAAARGYSACHQPANAGSLSPTWHRAWAWCFGSRFETPPRSAPQGSGRQLPGTERLPPSWLNRTHAAPLRQGKERRRRVPDEMVLTISCLCAIARVCGPRGSSVPIEAVKEPAPSSVPHDAARSGMTSRPDSSGTAPVRDRRLSRTSAPSSVLFGPSADLQRDGRSFP